MTEQQKNMQRLAADSPLDEEFDSFKITMGQNP